MPRRTDMSVWEQMYAAYHFKTTNIWIINVGDLKFLEVPLEYFMNLAYDFEAWKLDSLPKFLQQWSLRQFGGEPNVAPKIASILLRYSVSHQVLSFTSHEFYRQGLCIETQGRTARCRDLLFGTS